MTKFKINRNESQSLYSRRKNPKKFHHHHLQKQQKISMFKLNQKCFITPNKNKEQIPMNFGETGERERERERSTNRIDLN